MIVTDANIASALCLVFTLSGHTPSIFFLPAAPLSVPAAVCLLHGGGALMPSRFVAVLEGEPPGEPLAIDGQRGAGRNASVLGRSHDERAEPPHLFLQQADGVIEFVAAERVAAHELGESIGFMYSGGSCRPHLVKRNGHAARRSLPGGFRTSEAAADDGDHATVSASSSERA